MSILKIHIANYVMLKKTIAEMKSVEITKNVLRKEIQIHHLDSELLL